MQLRGILITNETFHSHDTIDYALENEDEGLIIR